MKRARLNPVVELSRRFTFSAAHRLHSKSLSDEQNVAIFGKCNNPNGHGHNYVVQVSYRGQVDKSTGMVVNISDVKRDIAHVEAALDHKCLDKDVPFFEDNVSTTEMVAVFVWEELKKAPLGSWLSKVEIWETENNKFVFAGEYDSK